jgi:hypothetical protein
MQSRAHGFALLVFALPESLPTPIPSLSAVLGIPLLLIAAHLVLFGNAALPASLGRTRVPVAAIRAVTRVALPALRWIETWSHPRWPAIGEQTRIPGIAASVLALLLFLPIPLFNLPPALALVILALGLIQRDGLLIAAGCLGAVVLGAATIVLAGSIGAWLVDSLS